uniref:Uncharacterized protein n=1 Tax=Magallana gigas TaxID=29159 RepID=K1PQ83_MAGGI
MASFIARSKTLAQPVRISGMIQTFGTCYSNKKTFKRELGSCDGLLYPFADGNTGEKCKIKRELENCVVMAAKECENDEVTEHIKIISNGLFDYLYKTQDCVEESSKDEKEHTPEPEIKSVEGLDSDDNEDSNNGKGAGSTLYKPLAHTWNSPLSDRRKFYTGDHVFTFNDWMTINRNY